LRFYVTEKLGPNREITGAGFLLCKDVVVARVGEQLYLPEELQGDGQVFEPASDGFVHVMRDAKEVFSRNSMLSLNGASICNDHPAEDVNTKNFRELTMGTVFNVHRVDDYLVADLLICDDNMIMEIEAGKNEVSCGYDAKYIDLGKGRARQEEIFHNHLAIVDEGRCGTECAIGDRKPVTKTQDCGCKGESAMAKNFTKTVDKIVSIFSSTRDAKSFKDKLEKEYPALVEDESAESDKEDSDKHDSEFADRKSRDAALAKMVKDSVMDAMKGVMDRLEKLEGESDEEDAEDDEEEKTKDKKAKDKRGKDKKAKDEDEIEREKKIEAENDKKTADAKDEDWEEEAPEGTTDEEVKTCGDSRHFHDSFRSTRSAAEILAPGIELPTFDQAAQPKKTFDSICDMRRRALARVAVEDSEVVEKVYGRKLTTDSLKKMGCGQLRSVFTAATALKTDKRRTGDAMAVYTPITEGGTTIETAQERLKSFWK